VTDARLVQKARHSSSWFLDASNKQHFNRYLEEGSMWQLGKWEVHTIITLLATPLEENRFLLVSDNDASL
jgi:hypothetical protein